MPLSDRAEYHAGSRASTAGSEPRAHGFSAFGTFRRAVPAFSDHAHWFADRLLHLLRLRAAGETIRRSAWAQFALAAELFEPARMFAWIVVVIATALTLNTLVSMIENRMRAH
jgi:hypothetical protein